MSLWPQPFGFVEEPDRQIKLVRQPFVAIAYRTPAVGTESADNTRRLGKGLWRPPRKVELARPIPDPDGEWTADGPSAIVIVIVAYPERLTVHGGGNRPAKAGPGFNARHPALHGWNISGASDGTGIPKLSRCPRGSVAPFDVSRAGERGSHIALLSGLHHLGTMSPLKSKTAGRVAQHDLFGAAQDGLPEGFAYRTG